MHITGKINRQFPRRNNACPRQLVCVRYGCIVRSTVKHVIAGICAGQPYGIDNILRSHIASTIIGDIFTAVNGADIVPVHIDIIPRNKICGIWHVDFIIVPRNDLLYSIGAIIHLGNSRIIIERNIDMTRSNRGIIFRQVVVINAIFHRWGQGIRTIRYRNTIKPVVGIANAHTEGRWMFSHYCAIIARVIHIQLIAHLPGSTVNG